MNRDEKALSLLEGIGEIEDIYLTEATSYKKKKPARAIFIPIIAAALALCLAMTMLLSLAVMVPVGVVIAGELGLFDKSAMDEAPNLEALPTESEPEASDDEAALETNEESEASPSDEPFDDGYAVLDSLLRNSENGRPALKSMDDIYYGKASIIWQDGESGEIFVEELTTAELEGIKRNLGKGEKAGESSPKLNYRVWIVDENRSVISPYLESGLGNQGFEIFDYEAEIIPNEDLIECISDILE